MNKNLYNYKYNDVLRFWFTEENKPLWFSKKDYFDKIITKEFLGLYEEAAKGLLDSWKKCAHSALALIIILDQFPRNMFRGLAQSFATDSKALFITKQSIDKGMDLGLTSEYKLFFYMPLMHSENLEDQKLCVQLFENDSQPLSFAKMHMNIIEKFGRFPHRNSILGRESTEEETHFLMLPNSSF